MSYTTNKIIEGVGIKEYRYEVLGGGRGLLVKVDATVEEMKAIHVKLATSVVPIAMTIFIVNDNGDVVCDSKFNIKVVDDCICFIGINGIHLGYIKIGDVPLKAHDTSTYIYV